MPVSAAPECHGALFAGRVVDILPSDAVIHMEEAAMHPLAREIGILLILKIIALSMIFFLFFPSSKRPHVDSGHMADRILATEQNQ